MLTQAKIKLIAALKVKKYRQKYQKFTVEGEKMVLECLRSGAILPEAVYGLAFWGETHSDLFQRTRVPFFPVDEAQLKKISTLQTPNKALALLSMPEYRLEKMLPLNGYAFFLDGVQDPGNLGAIWRIADWFGMPALFASPDSVDGWSPKVIQAGMGAFLRVPFLEISIEELLNRQPTLPVYGALMEGPSLYNFAGGGGGLVVVGQEGRGISPGVQQRVQHQLSIPRGAGGGAESLNAAVAAGIIAAFLHKH